MAFSSRRMEESNSRPLGYDSACLTPTQWHHWGGQFLSSSYNLHYARYQLTVGWTERDRGKPKQTCTMGWGPRTRTVCTAEICNNHYAKFPLWPLQLSKNFHHLHAESCNTDKQRSKVQIMHVLANLHAVKHSINNIDKCMR